MYAFQTRQQVDGGKQMQALEKGRKHAALGMDQDSKGQGAMVGRDHDFVCINRIRDDLHSKEQHRQRETDIDIDIDIDIERERDEISAYGGACLPHPGRSDQ